jgi:uncharacterized protein YigA (DUF484 family)
MIIYFVSGIIAGLSVSAYFIGKELFVIHRKNSLQEKQLDRMRKLNHQLSTKISLISSNKQTAYVNEKGTLVAQ